MGMKRSQPNQRIEVAASPVGPLVVVGAGVVGRAIAGQLARHGIGFVLIDRCPEAIAQAGRQLLGVDPALSLVGGPGYFSQSHAVACGGAPASVVGALVIESIAEDVQAKRALFVEAASLFGPGCVLASNTSNLSIGEIFAPLPAHPGCLGMHFFMPVGQRPLVELIARPGTSAAAVQRCAALAAALGKRVLPVADHPGFVVNRLLAPYLNQALLLLGSGASAGKLDGAARRLGMPMSPLRLIDLIGLRTAFDSGRVFWRHFPKRIDPAPILAGMIKAGRLGASQGGGFFDWSAAEAARALDADELAADRLSAPAAEVVQRYTRQQRRWSEQQLVETLAIPIWIEAAEIMAAGVVSTAAEVELGLSGGLGYRGDFFAFVDSLDWRRVLGHVQGGSGALSAPAGLVQRLRQGHRPSVAAFQYAALAESEPPVDTAVP